MAIKFRLSPERLDIVNDDGVYYTTIFFPFGLDGKNYGYDDFKAMLENTQKENGSANILPYTLRALDKKLAESIEKTERLVG